MTIAGWWASSSKRDSSRGDAACWAAWASSLENILQRWARGISRWCFAGIQLVKASRGSWGPSYVVRGFYPLWVLMQRDECCECCELCGRLVGRCPWGCACRGLDRSVGTYFGHLELVRLHSIIVFIYNDAPIENLYIKHCRHPTTKISAFSRIVIEIKISRPSWSRGWRSKMYLPGIFWVRVGVWRKLSVTDPCNVRDWRWRFFSCAISTTLFSCGTGSMFLWISSIIIISKVEVVWSIGLPSIVGCCWLAWWLHLLAFR